MMTRWEHYMRKIKEYLEIFKLGKIEEILW